MSRGLVSNRSRILPFSRLAERFVEVFGPPTYVPNFSERIWKFKDRRFGYTITVKLKDHRTFYTLAVRAPNVNVVLNFKPTKVEKVGSQLVIKAFGVRVCLMENRVDVWMGKNLRTEVVWFF